MNRINDEELEDVIFQLKEIFKNVDGAHDFNHTMRVVQNARKIARREEIDENIIFLAALLHDVDDHKLCENSDEQVHARKILKGLDIADVEKEFVLKIIGEISFSKGKAVTSIEAQIVQDADRLDAIGAIGIARAFTYGGKTDSAIYEEGDVNCTVQHFHDKLLKIKSLMGTESGKAMAKKRTEFMSAYLDELYCELGVGPWPV